jgi:hypothetical protein
MADNAWVSKWDFKDKHVDTNLTPSNDFMSSARCLIYAAPSQLNTPITPTTQDVRRTTFHRIGVIQGWNWGENRQIEMIFELGSEVPYLVPGRTTGQISISRIMLFGKDLTNMVYSEEFDTQTGVLSDPAKFVKSIREINKPFDLMFAAFSNTDDTKVYSRVYTNCWIQSKNESVSAGQILIAENVNIMYESVVSVSIPTPNP